MKNARNSRRLINTELATKGANQRIMNVIADHTPKEEQSGLKIDFYCECSDETCREHVPLTLEQFEELHDDQSMFVIAKGHETPAVVKCAQFGEKILQINPSYTNVFGTGLPGMSGTSVASAELVPAAQVIEGDLLNLQLVGCISKTHCNSLINELYQLLKH